MVTSICGLNIIMSSSSLPHHDHCDQLLWNCPGLWPVPELGLYTKSIIRPHSKLHIIKLTALIYILNLLPVKLSAFRYLRCQVLVFKSESFLCPIRNYETVIAIKKACMKVFKASIEHFLLWLAGWSRELSRAASSSKESTSLAAVEQEEYYIE